MSTLQKFKLIATQCAKSGSPTQSPTTSPVFQFRRRKTLKMFLSRSTAASASGVNREEREADPEAGKKGGLIGSKLRDLFVASPEAAVEKRGEESEVLIERVRRTISGRRGGGRSVAGAYRYRLLRRPWRPVLVTIPE